MDIITNMITENKFGINNKRKARNSLSILEDGQIYREVKVSEDKYRRVQNYLDKLNEQGRIISTEIDCKNGTHTYYMEAGDVELFFIRIEDNVRENLKKILEVKLSKTRKRK